MSWYGKVALGLLAGIVGWIIGVLIAKKEDAEAKPPVPVELAGWLLTFAVILYTSWHEWHKWM